MPPNTLTDSQRLDRLESTEQIRTLKARYAEALDNRFNADEVSALFAEDATWQIGKEEVLIQGRPAIKAHCMAIAKSISWSIHYFFPSVIQINDDGVTATGSFYFLDLQTLKNEAGEDEAYLFAGKFRDKFKKIDGAWYFDHVFGTVDQVAPWTAGWVNKSFIPNFFASK